MRVIAVAPGLVRTALSARITANPAATKASEAMHPLDRLGEPDEIAQVIDWLLSPEASLALILAVRRPESVPFWLVGLGLLLVLANALSTAILQVPMHRRLSGGYDRGAHRALVRTNVARTLAWTLRAAIAFAILALRRVGSDVSYHSHALSDAETSLILLIR